MPQEPVHFLTDYDRKLLQEVVKRVNTLPRNTTGRTSYVPDSPYLDTNSRPKTYAARTPPEGIPALGSLSIGTSSFPTEVEGALCQVFQVDNIDGTLRIVEENKPFVYNLSRSDIPGDKWVIVVGDDYGSWFAIGLVGDEIGTGTGSGTEDDGGGSGETPCDLLKLNLDDCVVVHTPYGDFYLRYMGDRYWSSLDIFEYGDGYSGTFEFFFFEGRFHLRLGGKDLLECGNGCYSGSWITGHFGPQTGTGPDNDSCDGEVITVCVECDCCPIEGWQGPGYYCIRDTYPTGTGFSGTGTGTGAADCVAVELYEIDKCDESITICSGRYETEQAAIDACDPVSILVPCCNNEVPAILNVTVTGKTGTCTCLPNSFTLVYSASMSTGFPGWESPTYCGTVSFRLRCTGGIWELAWDASDILLQFSAQCSPFQQVWNLNTTSSCNGTAILTITG